MRFRCAFASLVSLITITSYGSEIVLTDAQEGFRREVGARLATVEKSRAGALAGADGWLFLASELRFLARGLFWGEAATKMSRASADPVPAIVDFHRQLRERGIDLLLVPVPPKGAIYPEQIAPGASVRAKDAAPFLAAFYDELRGKGIDVLDLTPTFFQGRKTERGPVFCLTDSHWSGVGCIAAAQAIADRVRAKIAPVQRTQYNLDWNEIAITGDLVGMLPEKTARLVPERLAVRTVTEKASGAGVQPDGNSPVLVMGDSHTLVFHEFLAQRAGLLDQLAHELGFAPDLIGTRGSGATAVRISLYRRTRSDPTYLAKKKLVVWCFAAREFSEADQGWVVQPIAK